MNVIDTAVAYGLDSFLACALIGGATLVRGRVALVIAFGVFDAVGTALAPMLGRRVPAFPEMATWIVFVAVLALAARYRRRLVYLLPAVLALDNLSAPSSLSPVAAGLASCALAATGLAAGLLGRQVIEGVQRRLALG